MDKLGSLERRQSFNILAPLPLNAPRKGELKRKQPAIKDHTHMPRTFKQQRTYAGPMNSPRSIIKPMFMNGWVPHPPHEQSNAVRPPPPTLSSPTAVSPWGLTGAVLDDHQGSNIE